MAKQIFAANALTGGTSGCLDDILHTSLEDGNIAIVIDISNDSGYFYKYDTSEAGTESSPDIIIPDSNATGTGAWVRVGFETGIPAGAVMAFAMETEPEGWLECDGSAISRVTYATLFAAIGTIHGVGNGTTTFNLPDYRGRFLRGWDHGAGTDPNAATRTDAGDGSTTGDNVGTKQADAFEAHTHNIQQGYSAESTGGIVEGAGTLSGVVSGSTGGSETRPVNTNIMYCIKI